MEDHAVYSVLLLQIPGRDYVVPIDFIGEKYIEIPNDEVAWHVFNERNSITINLDGSAPNCLEEFVNHFSTLLKYGS